MNESIASAIEENVELIVGHYGLIASNFEMAKGFLSAAIGHAVVGLDDRSGLRDHLLAVADALERGELPTSRQCKPEPWTPVDGADGTAELTAAKIAGTFDKIYASRSDLDRATFDAAAVRAGLIMLSWHNSNTAAAAIRVFALALKDVPTGGIQ